jgi:hypothetical protein
MSAASCTLTLACFMIMGTRSCRWLRTLIRFVVPWRRFLRMLQSSRSSGQARLGSSCPVPAHVLVNTYIPVHATPAAVCTHPDSEA